MFSDVSERSPQEIGRQGAQLEQSLGGENGLGSLCGNRMRSGHLERSAGLGEAGG